MDGFDVQELYAALSGAQRRQSGTSALGRRPGPGTRPSSSLSGTRRGSFMPVTSTRSLAAGDGDDSDDDGYGHSSGDETLAAQQNESRRQSKKWEAAGTPSKRPKQRRGDRRHERNLFHFELRELVHDMLLTEGESSLSYHEYAVFAPSSPPIGSKEGGFVDSRRNMPEWDDDERLPQSSCVMEEGDEALDMLREGVGKAWGLDIDGEFTPNPKGSGRLLGRTRQVIVDRRPQQPGMEMDLSGAPDGLAITVEDYDMLALHPATLPSLQRMTVESHFWDLRKETLHLILSFSNSPQPPYDFLSMSYRLKSRTTTALIRRSSDPPMYQDFSDEEGKVAELDEYEKRLDGCRARWAHPLCLPIVMLQVQLYRIEDEVAANNSDVMMLGAHVSSVSVSSASGSTGHHSKEAWKERVLSEEKKISKRNRRVGRARTRVERDGEEVGGGVVGGGHGPLRKLAELKENVREKMSDTGGGFTKHAAASGTSFNSKSDGSSQGDDSGISGASGGSDFVPPQIIHLVREAHEVLRGSIRLLDTLRWMERAVTLVLQVGDELDERVREMRKDRLRRRRKSKNKNTKRPRASVGKKWEDGDDSDDDDEGEDEDEEDDLTYHWYEMRQYLDCTLRLCTALEMDRRLSEMRCRAQIDILYSMMAQEDNTLNSRMAIASTRDSSSMKALAILSAIFLPGSFVATLFSTDMFNWRIGTAGDDGAGNDAASWLPSPVVMPSFWVYWAFTIPLTLAVVAGWRAWWVAQDRYFRRHLSQELSTERFWTSDGKPRDLDTSYIQDFFSVLLSFSKKDPKRAAVRRGGGAGPVDSRGITSSGGKNGSNETLASSTGGPPRVELDTRGYATTSTRNNNNHNNNGNNFGDGLGIELLGVHTVPVSPIPTKGPATADMPYNSSVEFQRYSQQYSPRHQLQPQHQPQHQHQQQYQPQSHHHHHHQRSQSQHTNHYQQQQPPPPNHQSVVDPPPPLNFEPGFVRRAWTGESQASTTLLQHHPQYQPTRPHLSQQSLSQQQQRIQGNMDMNPINPAGAGVNIVVQQPMPAVYRQ